MTISLTTSLMIAVLMCFFNLREEIEHAIRQRGETVNKELNNAEWLQDLALWWILQTT